MTGNDLTRLGGELAALPERFATQVAAMFLSPGSPYSIGAFAIVFGIAVAATLSARRNTRTASSRSTGGPHTPLPVRRMAPYPSRLTVRSPPRVNVPDA